MKFDFNLKISFVLKSTVCFHKSILEKPPSFSNLSHSEMFAEA